MENTKGFYKFNEEALFYAPNFVECDSYKLVIEEKENYNLPVDGWYYFESEVEAKEFFNLNIE